MLTHEVGSLEHPAVAGTSLDRPSADRTVSVVVACPGQLAYTELCVSSVLRHSRHPVELVLVDMGSLDGTAEYLRGVAAAAPVPIQVLHSASDRGLAAAYNVGMAGAKGEFVLVLGNDTIVTADWLDHLLALADFAPEIGVVGAMSNSAPSLQSVGALPYRFPPGSVSRAGENGRTGHGATPIDEFARQWREANRGQWFEADQVAPFCLLLKRRVLEVIGPLEGTSPIALDGESFCRKVRQAGFRVACCRDLFIHHFGSRPSRSRAPSET